VTGEKDEVRVAVADHGVGIPPDRQARIFERFYTAHGDTAHDYGATGIGLYLAREFVRRHGGRMWFQSQEGIGSTFFFALPHR
jgi:signal transduction histidine kinase